jgi:hypothetical protein
MTKSTERLLIVSLLALAATVARSERKEPVVSKGLGLNPTLASVSTVSVPHIKIERPAR